jgi:hypothetical protein
MNTDYYGTIAEATDYFANRLHETAWTNADVTDRPKALMAATRIIDTLNFKGDKHSVWVWDQANPLGTPNATPANDRIADATQSLQFPRDDDTDVPEDIRVACYEIAHSLLDNKDPEIELENLRVNTESYGGTKTVYGPDLTYVEHLINMIPSALAWRILRPYLRDEAAISLPRVS